MALENAGFQQDNEDARAWDAKHTRAIPRPVPENDREEWIFPWMDTNYTVSFQPHHNTPGLPWNCAEHIREYCMASLFLLHRLDHGVISLEFEFILAVKHHSKPIVVNSEDDHCKILIELCEQFSFPYEQEMIDHNF